MAFGVEVNEAIGNVRAMGGAGFDDMSMECSAIWDVFLLGVFKELGEDGSISRSCCHELFFINNEGVQCELIGISFESLEGKSGESPMEITSNKNYFFSPTSLCLLG